MEKKIGHSVWMIGDDLFGPGHEVWEDFNIGPKMTREAYMTLSCQGYDLTLSREALVDFMNKVDGMDSRSRQIATNKRMWFDKALTDEYHGNGGSKRLDSIIDDICDLIDAPPDVDVYVERSRLVRTVSLPRGDMKIGNVKVIVQFSNSRRADLISQAVYKALKGESNDVEVVNVDSDMNVSLIRMGNTESMPNINSYAILFIERTVAKLPSK